MFESTMTMCVILGFVYMSTLIVGITTQPPHVPIAMDMVPIDMDMISNDWPLFVSRYCGRMCQNGSLVIIPDYCNDPQCFPCDCHKYCSLKGTCCPVVDVDNEKGTYEFNMSFQNSYLDYIYQRVECRRPFNSESVLTVVKCPVTWKDKNIQQKCEQPEGYSPDVITPFTDHNSGLVFTNVFCVLCHGFDPYAVNSDYGNNASKYAVEQASKFEAWPVGIYCLNYDNIFHLTDKMELYKKAIELEECYITFSTPANITRCPSSFGNSFNKTDSSCSSDTNETLRELCHNLPAIPALGLSFGNPKNIFCKLCGGSVMFSGQNDTCSIWPGINNPGDITPSIEFLFRVSRKYDQDEDAGELLDCSPGELKLEEGQCISPICPAGKSMNGDRCVTPFQVFRGFVYKVNMMIVFEMINPYLIISLPQVIKTIKETLRRNSFHTKFKMTATMCVDRDQYLGVIDVMGYIRASINISRDDFERDKIDNLTKSSWQIPIIDTIYGNNTIQLRTVCLGETLCTIYRLESKEDSCYVLSSTTDGYMMGYRSELPDISPSLVCPYVILNMTAEPVVVNRSIIFTTELRNQPLHLEWDTNTSIVGDEFRVCFRLLSDIISQLDNQFLPVFNNPDNNILSSINYYLDIVCIVISCMCLLASIMTYLLFPSLLSIAGFNNLCLCLSLLAAQVSLLITTLFGTRGLITKFHCLLHAIFLHYSWIASFVWMNTCCIHMFRVFRGHTMRSPRRESMRYCLYSFGCPFLVLATVMTLSATMTKGRSIGYDFDVCFFDSRISIFVMILGLLSPLCCTVLVNGVLFVFTVKVIMDVTKLQNHHRNSPGLITYVKLSTVTGAFCFFAAAAVQLESPILSLISSPFAALQGVFIFTSFIANGRVLKMYISLLNCPFTKIDVSTHSTVDIAIEKHSTMD